MNPIDMLSPDWWNGVSGIASIISLITLVTAFVAWMRSRHRLEEGLLECISYRQDDKDMIRIQNIGETGCLIRDVFVKYNDMTLMDDEPWKGMLSPGECRYGISRDLSRDSEIVILYYVISDMGMLHAIRFQPGLPDDFEYTIDSLRGLSKGTVGEMLYRGEDWLFENSGIASRHRLIRRPITDSDQFPSRRFVQLLNEDGYRSL